MNSKQIGIILMIIGIVTLVFVSGIKTQEDHFIEQYISAEGTCYLDDGTCLHNDRNMNFYILGYVVAGVLLFMGVYLRFFDKTEEKLMEHQKEVSRALREAKTKEKTKDEFTAFLQGFNNDEQKILRAIEEQDGVTQSTLRYRVDMSKTSLSLMLKSLEERKFISREESGKTNKIHLVKKF